MSRTRKEKSAMNDEQDFAEEPTETPAEASAEPAPPEDPIAALRREVEELRDKNLRVIAEAHNQQKRAQREKQESLRYAEADFGRDLLVVLDDLERTLSAAGKATDVQTVIDGVRIVYDHFLKVLAQHHIQPIEAAGQRFDPSYHEAMLQQPSDEHAAGMVVQELARGYQMHERVIRPSRVIVSSGPGPASDEKSEQE